MKKLGLRFFDRDDVVAIAKELIGKIIVTNFDGEITTGRIVETEAYIGLIDRASHSFGGKRTSRNEHMYADAATSYVYICYGMHHLFNVVTNKRNIPDAVLIRAVEPIAGIPVMLKRTGKKQLDNTLTRGPGNAGKALGISKSHSGLNLLGDEIFISDDKAAGYIPVNEEQIGISGRIGVEGAGKEAAQLPYRFYLRGNKYVSASPTK